MFQYGRLTMARHVIHGELGAFGGGSAPTSPRAASAPRAAGAGEIVEQRLCGTTVYQSLRADLRRACRLVVTEWVEVRGQLHSFHDCNFFKTAVLGSGRDLCR